MFASRLFITNQVRPEEVIAPVNDCWPATTSACKLSVRLRESENALYVPEPKELLNFGVMEIRTQLPQGQVSRK